ncbi:unnamed protein product [Caenorhabditis nigoni]
MKIDLNRQAEYAKRCKLCQADHDFNEFRKLKHHQDLCKNVRCNEKKSIQLAQLCNDGIKTGAPIAKKI